MRASLWYGNLENKNVRMRKKNDMIRYSFAAVLALLLASCVKDELYNTPHPDKGVIAVTINQPQGAEEDDTVLVYNTPEGFTVTDGIAYVERVDGTRALVDLINPLPETLYSGTKTVTVVADDTLHVDLDILQRTRDLRLELTVTEGDPERIASITGTLSGVARAYDLRNETLYGEAVSTAPAFTRSGDKVAADLRSLGTMGDRQTLTLRLSFLNGNPQDITIESDLTEQLADFNLGTGTITLDGELHTPTEAGVEAAIMDWKVVDGGSVDAH